MAQRIQTHWDIQWWPILIILIIISDRQQVIRGNTKHGESMQTETDGAGVIGLHVVQWRLCGLEVGRKTAAQLPAASPAVRISVCELQATSRRVSLWRAAAAVADGKHPPGLTCLSALSL